MAISPTARTLKRMRTEGVYPLVEVVEHWSPFGRGGQGIRKDLFTIIDILAIDEVGTTVAVQVTSYSNMRARINKIKDSEAITHLRKAGWVILVEGWHKNSKNRWTSKIVDVS